MRLLNYFVAFFAVSLVLVGALITFGNYGGSLLSVDGPKDSSPPISADQNDNYADFLSPISFKRDDSENENITKDLATELGRDIFVRNPEGPATIDDKKWINVVDPEVIVQSLTEDGFKNFNPKEFQPEVKLTDLKINPNSNQSLSEVYLKTFRSILSHNFKDTKVDFEHPELIGIKNLINAYDQSVKNFYNLEVPQNLIEIHRKEISLLTGQQKVFIAMANYQQDPLQAMLVGKVYGQLEKEFKDLKLEINEFISENKLNI